MAYATSATRTVLTVLRARRFAAFHWWVLAMPRRWFAFASKIVNAGQGVNDSWILTSQSIGKANSDVSPYLIANELICANIATFLRLPVPPFALMRKSRTEKGMFASLSFGSKDPTPDDAVPSHCIRCLPELCAGVLLFDVLIANPDRGVHNLKVDDPFNPKLLHVYDHERALFGWKAGSGKKRLQRLWDKLGVLGNSGSGYELNRHCFLDEIKTANHFPQWADRIRQIPVWFIKDVCSESVGLGITSAYAEVAFDFLRHRAQRIGQLILKNKAEFPLVKDWGFDI
jgi:hypothetical protein